MIRFSMVLFFCYGLFAGESITLVFHQSGEWAGCVSVSGLDSETLTKLKNMDEAALRDRFMVFLGDTVPTDQISKPPMLGSYDFNNGSIFFQPRFSFLADRDHIARFVDEVGNGKDFRFVPRAKVKGSAPVVTAIEPGAAEVPANLLRLYIYFDHAMAPGQAKAFVNVLNGRGEVIEQPFVDVEGELWDAENRRLTLIFHPGRIKRGLHAREELGAPLTEGGLMTVVVASGYEDAWGQALETTVRKQYRVTAADRVSPVIEDRHLGLPLVGGQDPLWLRFDEPLDKALLARWVLVLDEAGVEIPGSTVIAQDGRSWRFVPLRPWENDVYKLQIHPRIEDLAGNRLDRLFDEAMGEELKGGESKARFLTWRPRKSGDQGM